MITILNLKNESIDKNEIEYIFANTYKKEQAQTSGVYYFSVDYNIVMEAIDQISNISGGLDYYNRLIIEIKNILEMDGTSGIEIKNILTMIIQNIEELGEDIQKITEQAANCMLIYRECEENILVYI